MALKIEVHADAAAVALRAAVLIAACANRAVAARDRCVLALSGGQTPRLMLGLLARQAVAWRKVELVQVDERVAPLGSPARNLTQLQEMLLARVPLPAAQVHAMPVAADDLEAAAAGYGALLVRLAGSPPRLDLIQLGLGADGHTASLLPGDAALDIADSAVGVTAAYHGWRRMTLTVPLINRARRILWLVTGADKAAAVARLVAADPALAASRIGRKSALLLLDQTAAAGLPVAAAVTRTHRGTS